MDSQPTLPTTEPRGMRNCNPGNIRANPQFVWMGQTGKDDKGFCIFSDPKYGVRALLVLFHNYQEHYQLHTLSQLINRWAPPNENDTVAYTHYMSGYTRTGPLQPFDVTLHARDLAHGIVHFEQGRDPYPEGVYTDAIQLAFTQR